MGAHKGDHRSPSTEFKPGHDFSNKYRPEYADEMLEYFSNHDAVPMFEEFANSKKVTATTMLNWAKKYPRFAAVYDICREIAQTKLLQGGLSGRYNPQIVKLIAMNKHGMSEKSEQKVDASVDGELKVNITVLKPEKVDVNN